MPQIDWFGMGNFFLQMFAVLLCLTVHEVSHGFVAYLLGDPTAKAQHRLSLNPIHHIDVFGLLMMVTVGFGWAKPVPVDARYFRNPKSGMAWTALAGPLSNILFAYVACCVLQASVAVAQVRGIESGLWVSFLQILVMMNIGLAIFNLIPFPPLDGSKILAMILPVRVYGLWMRYEHLGMFVLMAVLWLGYLDIPLHFLRSALTDFLLRGSDFVYGLTLGFL